MDQEAFLRFYEQDAQKPVDDYDIFPEEQHSLISEADVKPAKYRRIVNGDNFKGGSNMMRFAPLLYNVLAILSMFLAVSKLPTDHKIYLFYDDPISNTFWMIICISAMSLLGVLIQQVLYLSFSNKDVPFLRITRQNKQTFNKLVTYIGQFSHMLLLAQLIAQQMPSTIMKFEHEVLLGLSLTTSIVYMAYVMKFAHTNIDKSILRIGFFIVYCVATLTFLTQNFITQMKLHYTIPLKGESIHILLPYVALLCQGCFYALFYPILKQIGIQLQSPKHNSHEIL